MFSFVVRYLGFLKFIPGMGLVFDAWLKIVEVLSGRKTLDYIDRVEAELERWEGLTTSIHKYGGLQFNYGRRELGHIHSNGLLDMLLSRQIKQQLMAADERVLHHHSFKNSGWISFYIRSEEDAGFATSLLKTAYDRCKK